MNLKQQTFVTEYLRHRSAYTAYCIAYNTESSNYESVMSAANRLLHHPEVSATINSILGTIRKEVEEEVRQELKTELLTVQHKRELLARIARGEMYVPQNYKGKDCSQCTQMVTPTINQMLKAIDLDSKLAGHYSAQQTTPIITSSVIAAPGPQLHERQSQLAPNINKTQQELTVIVGPDPQPQPIATKAPSGVGVKTPLLNSGGEHYEERIALRNAGEVFTRRPRHPNKVLLQGLG